MICARCGSVYTPGHWAGSGHTCLGCIGKEGAAPGTTAQGSMAPLRATGLPNQSMTLSEPRPARILYDHPYTPVFMLAHDYCTHHAGCLSLQSEDAVCTCGLQEAIQEALEVERYFTFHPIWATIKFELRWKWRTLRGRADNGSVADA